MFIRSHHLHVTNLVKKIVNKKKKIHDPFYSHLEFYLFALQMDTYFTKNNLWERACLIGYEKKLGHLSWQS
jgi:hypothetical protein